MSWVATAIGGAAVINYFGQQGAARTQADAANNATAQQGGMFNTIQGQNKPFVSAGTTALNSLMYGQGIGGTNADGTPINSNDGISAGQFTKGFSPTDFTNNLDPGYQFQLDQGGQAIRNADTPSQGALSGSALKDLTAFNSNMASTGYQNAFNRWNTTQNNIFSRLSGIAGLGQASANNTAAAGTTLGTGMAQSTAAAGAATAGGIVGGANALSGAAVPLAYMMQNGSTTNGTGVNSADYWASQPGQAGNILTAPSL